jgi:hypothetical protein
MRRARAPPGPNGIMQTIAKRLSPDDIRNVASYLQASAVMRGSGCCLALALLLAACGKQESTGEHSAAVTAGFGHTGRGERTRRVAAQQKKAEQAGDLPSKITRIERGRIRDRRRCAKRRRHAQSLAGSGRLDHCGVDVGGRRRDDQRPDAVAGRRQLHAYRAGAADPVAGPSRGAGVFLVRLPALLCPRPHDRVVEKDQTGLHHLFARSRDVERGPSLPGAPVLHAREHGQAGSAARAKCSRKYTSTAIPLVAPDENNTAETERIQTAFVKKFGISADEFKRRITPCVSRPRCRKRIELTQRYRVSSACRPS